ncbi:MAG: sulfotransferase [Fibrobacteres bacterium]|nr:sulfotransferase [Fibrobacterota bacterium]
MPEYLVHQDAYEKANQCILIVGPGRTGSTLTGRILQTFAGIEYVYESAMLHTLIPLVARLPRREFQLLFETYLYEEKLIELVAGRAWNFNEKDESSILKVKSESEIKARTGVSLGKLSAMEKARGAVLAVKMTDVTPFVGRLKEIYPGMRFVLTHREAYGCIASLLKKEWFSDETLRTRGLVWNGIFDEGMLRPHWVPEAKRAAWPRMSALERSALYYREMYAALNGVQGPYLFSYDRLLKEPAPAVRDLARWLGLGMTPGTERILASVKDHSAMEKSLLDGLSSTERAETLRFSDPDYVAGLMKE